MRFAAALTVLAIAAHVSSITDRPNTADIVLIAMVMMIGLSRGKIG